jgi:membrane-bound ClpP family serine protease
MESRTRKNALLLALLAAGLALLGAALALMAGGIDLLALEIATVIAAVLLAGAAGAVLSLVAKRQEGDPSHR